MHLLQAAERLPEGRLHPRRQRPHLLEEVCRARALPHRRRDAQVMAAQGTLYIIDILFMHPRASRSTLLHECDVDQHLSSEYFLFSEG